LLPCLHCHRYEIFLFVKPCSICNVSAYSQTMESGTIAKWNLKEGDKFDVGTSLCEVETDKATVSFDATDEGYVAKILVSSGDIKVGQPILVTVEDNNSLAAFKNYTHEGGTSAPAPKAAAAPTPAAAPAAPAPTPSAPAAAPTSAPSSSSQGERIFASPLAKKLARESGTTIEAIAAQLRAASSEGSGPNGRIVAADVMRASTLPRATAASTQSASTTAAAPAAAKPTATAPSSSTTIAGVYSDFELSETAQALAARQTHAKQVVPHYYLSVDLNLSELLKVRASFNAQAAAAKKKGGVELSVQDFLVKAAALAMQQVPDVNGSWMDTFVRRYEQVRTRDVARCAVFPTEVDCVVLRVFSNRS
jgi:pyruvate dehydrogenase E2 component (dihydrolipoamide acetyltransferase)